MQLRFASLVVINLREDLHLQECARAGRTNDKARIAGLVAFHRSGIVFGSSALRAD